MNNVWLINQFSNTPDLPGHTRQFEIAKFLASKDYKVELYSSNFNLNERKFRRLRKYNLILVEKVENVLINWLWVVPYKKNNWLRKINLISFCIHLFIRLFIKSLRDIVVCKT